MTFTISDDGCSLKARTQHDVAENLVVIHLDMADGDTQA